MLQQSSWGGLKVVVVEDRPRYQLPEELIPGVPWNKEFRDEFNQWARSFLGSTNQIPDGQMGGVGGMVFVNPRTYDKLRQEFRVHTM